MLLIASIFLVIDVLLVVMAFCLFLQAQNTRTLQLELEGEFRVHRLKIEKEIQNLVKDRIKDLDSRPVKKQLTSVQKEPEQEKKRPSEPSQAYLRDEFEHKMALQRMSLATSLGA